MSSVASASETVKVGGYIFPPFVEEDSEGNLSGMTFDMINAFNAIQDQYHFEFVLTASNRRYLSFQKKEYDLIFFENKVWGWKGYPVKPSKVYLKGSEVYIALKKPKRTQHYFNSLEGKKLVGIRGYHYGFANFNSNEQYLNENFNILLTSDHQGSVNMISSGRGDIAVVTKSFLQKLFKAQPLLQETLLVSEILDQEYHHTILVRDNSVPTVQEINLFLDKLESLEHLKTIWSKYGITEMN
ncbi:substrate-binding periplasmic protein [Litoribacillus peritrichatus]|uniref:substrate-binding periplasmic protein n=1 Tax=Litoribacillus peritrichatus TaxID=718191 RepID=UPI003CD0C31A